MRDGRFRAIVWMGVCLPDAAAWALETGFGAPEALTIPLRSPLGLLPWCAAGALLFEADWRGRAFAALLAGALARLLVEGPIFWAFPFAMERAESGVPAYALLLAPLVEAVFRRLRARRPGAA